MAANTRGIALVEDLIVEYGLETVQAYMRFIQVGVQLQQHFCHIQGQAAWPWDMFLGVAMERKLFALCSCGSSMPIWLSLYAGV